MITTAGWTDTMKTPHIYYNIALRALASLMTAICLLLAGACATADKTDPATAVCDAEQALADGDTAMAAEICNQLMTEDFDRLDETQLGKLAVLFAKLSETEKSDENIADATQCVRQAWKLSADSLRGFISTLPPEDMPHFIMLMRISGSIDFPPDLSEDHYAEDSIHIQP